MDILMFMSICENEFHIWIFISRDREPLTHDAMTRQKILSIAVPEMSDLNILVVASLLSYTSWYTLVYRDFLAYIQQSCMIPNICFYYIKSNVESLVDASVIDF